MSDQKAKAALRWAVAVLLLSLSALLQPVSAATAERGRPFAVDDYFKLRRFSDLALSSDGAWLAYRVERTSLESDRSEAQVHVQSLSDKMSRPTALQDASALAWIPGTHRLAFLSASSGTMQVHFYDVDSSEVRQLTHAIDSVISFRVAPDGTQIAYATRVPPKAVVSLYEQFRTGTAGILIDPNTLTSHDFLNPDWNAQVDPPPPTLWVLRPGVKPSSVPVPGDPQGDLDGYHWSSDGRALSIVYVRKDGSREPLSGDLTSIGIFDLLSRRFRPLADAVAPSDQNLPIRYSGGEWIPDERRLLLRRVIESDPWVGESFPDWAIAGERGRLPKGEAWHAVELYPRGLNVFPMKDGILVETTVRAQRSLFRLIPGGLQRSPLLAGIDGSSDQFQFSGDGRTIAFINQSLTRPPEIFVKRGTALPKRVTAFNQEIAQRISYAAREIRWTSSDGREIAGWLLTPLGHGSGPFPLIAHVHGGPAFAYPNAFAAYFSYWPYPLEVYPALGIAVFLPNYRGTHSFGRDIATTKGDKASIADILNGVQALIERGIADPKRLAVSGHSHGALVGPLAMTASKRFRASSFAEGASNQVVMYELVGSDANRQIHDPVMGVSLYDSPQTYIDGSADLQLRGVHTASLFEAGPKSSAIYMLGLAKAAPRFGLPSEFIIYPQTDHNLAIPHLQKESATRNLDWFDFWLNNREDPDSSKRVQYARWRKLRGGP